jgi:hypothetical protein
VRCPSAYRAFPTAVSSAEDSGRYSNAPIVIDLVATRYEWRPLVESGTICRWLAFGFAWQDQAIGVPWLRCVIDFVGKPAQ